MDEVGVTAIVKGLTSFMSGMKKVDGAIAGIVPTSSLLGRALTGVGGIVQWLTGSVFRVLEYTLGNLLSAAIQTVVKGIKDLVAGAIEAGSEFQKLEIRLRTLNFNTLVESGMAYSDAMKEATSDTKEQLSWLLKLANTTPYDAQDIANVFTLAKSYGFTSQNAQKLTEDIANFASGMGLGNEEIKRIIVNLGQMQQQGKVTQRDLNDLARGAFVPVNDVLKLMQEQTGKTGAAFDEFLKTTEGVEAFGVAFSTLVEQRFANSAQEAGRAFQYASDNAKDFIKSIVGFNIVKPILRVLGGQIADFVGVLSDDKNLSKINTLTSLIGDTVSRTIGGILKIGPGAQGMADMIIEGLSGVSSWLMSHQGDIISWVQTGIDWVKNKLVPALGDAKDFLFGTKEGDNKTSSTDQAATRGSLPVDQAPQTGALEKFATVIRDTVIPAVIDLSNWVGNVLIPFLSGDLTPLIIAILPLLSSFGGVLSAMLGTEPNTSLSDWIHGTLIPGIQQLTEWINTNQETIATWVKIFLILSTVMTLVFGVISFVIGLVISLTTVVIGVVSAIGFFTSGVGAAILILIGIILQIKLFEFSIRVMVGAVKIAVAAIIAVFNNMRTTILKTLKDIITGAKNSDWSAIGRAIIDGITNYIKGNAQILSKAVSDMVKNAVTAAKAAAGIKSPSKVFWNIGKMLMRGFADGITDTASLASNAMKGAVGATVSMASMAPAMASSMAPSSTVNNNDTRNYNLNIHTNAKTEPIIQDFNMLQSLGG